MKIIFYLSLFINFLLTQNHVFAKQPILILGDSLTEGYGIEKKNSYPSILQKILITNGYTNYRVINGGISGSTTASGKSRLRWFFKASPEIMILALGGNDGLRGLKVEQSEENLSTIIKMAKDKKIKVTPIN